VNRRLLIPFAALLAIVAVVRPDAASVEQGPAGPVVEEEAAAGQGRKTPEPPAESALKNGLLSTIHGTASSGRPNLLLEARLAADALPVSKVFGGGWKELGPKPFISDHPEYTSTNANGWGVVGGRITALAIDPTDAEIVVAGAAGGGVWRTTDGGDNWTPIGDDLPSTPVGAVAIDPEDPSTIFVGTGESNTGGDNIYGTGVYRTRNEGATWERVTQNIAPDSTVAFIEIAGGRIFVASSKGLWRSTDGGDSYHDVLLPTNEDETAPDEHYLSNIVSDVKAKPDNADQITAAVGWRRGVKSGSTPGGLYRSTEGGAPGTWTRLAESNFAKPSPNPHSTDPVGRTTLAYAEGEGQDHNVLWAVVQDPGVEAGDTLIGGAAVPPKYTSLNGVYRSGDDGATWTLKATSQSLATDPTSGLAYRLPLQYGPGIQSWYDQYIAVDPFDEERVILGLEEIYQSAPGANAPVGLSGFKVIGRYNHLCVVIYPCDPTFPGPVVGGLTTHPDQHAVVFGKLADGRVRLYAGGDGGVYRQEADAVTGYDNESWTSLNDTLGTTQPYDAVMGADGTVYLGLQDNGTAKITPDGVGIMTLGGDGFDVAVDPTNSDIAFGELPFADLRKTEDGGKNWDSVGPTLANAQFDTPFDMDPRDPQHMVIAGRQIVETVDQFNDFTEVFDVGHNEEADFDNSVSGIGVEGTAVYAGFCGVCDVITQGLGDVTKFHNGLATNVQPGCERATGSEECWHIADAEGLPNRYINDISVDQNDPSTIWVALGGYARRGFRPLSTTPGVGAGHLYVSHDAGQSFTNASGNLPEVVINAVVLRDSQIIVGTDVGTFVGEKGSGSFFRLGVGAPNAPVWDVELNPDGSKLVAATHGRGVWSYDFGAPASSGGSSRPGAGGGGGAPTPATGANPAVAMAGSVLLVLAVLARRLTRPTP